jgi:SP family sugar:H+ symporter-like MFS transporter
VIIFVFIFLFVPETKDRTLEEVDEMFEARLPARKFKGYACVNASHARAVGLHMADTKSEGQSSASHAENA